ncbi:MAG: PorT family protein [Bacteroidales bacterium]|nr:PorT family protein [Bacteroidales bacterium]
MNNTNKEQDQLDQLFRETLSNHQVEPRPRLWKEINRKLLWKELTHFNFTNISKTYWFVAIASLILVPTIIWVIFQSGAASPVARTAENDPSSEVHQIYHSAIPISQPARIKTEPSAQKIHQCNSETGVKNEFSSSLPVISDVVNISRMNTLNSEEIDVLPVPDTILTFYTADGILRIHKGNIPPVHFFSAQLGIQPEVSFYSGESSYSKTNFWINGGLTWHISRFSLATGVGLGYVYDQGIYKIDYKSRDSIGFYNNVISFNVNGGNQIEYITETINVYDSIQHLADDRTNNRYTYIQIPFLLGYRFFESKRVNLTLQAGPAVSFLINTKEADPVINYSNARIIKIDKTTPSRIKTNWQLWANLYLEYQITKKISFYVAPSCQYYLNPMVEQENIHVERPWSVGLGIGVQYNFGQIIRKP